MTLSTEGKLGLAMRFAARRGQSGGSYVEPHWTKDLPLIVRAMVLADKTLFVAGPPDLIDEEETFSKLVARDPRVGEILAQQDAALEGDQGALLWAIDAKTGEKLAELKLKSLPTWDGLAAAGGRLYLTTADGELICLGK